MSCARINVRLARRTTIAILTLLSVAASGCGGNGSGNGNGVEGGIAAPQPGWEESFQSFANYEPAQDALIDPAVRYNQTFADKLGACGGRQSDVDWIQGAIENLHQRRFTDPVHLFHTEDVLTPRTDNRPPILATIMFYGGDYTFELTECEQLEGQPPSPG